MLSVPVSPRSEPVRGPGGQLRRDPAPPGQPWNVLSALGMKGDGQAGGSWAGWPGPRGGSPASPLLSSLCPELPQAFTASSGQGRGWGVGWQSLSRLLPSPPPCRGSSDTRGPLNPDFQDSDACAEASLHPETPERCLGGGPWVPGFHPGTPRPHPPGGPPLQRTLVNLFRGAWEPAPEGLLAPGLCVGHWVRFTEREPGPGAPSPRQAVVPGSPGLDSAGSGHLGMSRAWTGLDPGGRAEPSGPRVRPGAAVRVGEGPEVDQDGFLVASPTWLNFLNFGLQEFSTLKMLVVCENEEAD